MCLFYISSCFFSGGGGYNIYMKLFNGENDELYLTKIQWKKLFLATSILVIALYLAAMICSLCGSEYFILNYQNAQMDRIEAFLQRYYLMGLLNCVFSTIEFWIVISFVINKPAKWYYVISFYILFLIPYYIFRHLPSLYYTLFPFIFYFIVPLIDQLIENHKSLYIEKFSFKKYGIQMLRLLIAILTTFVLQFIIYGIKEGNLSLVNHVMNLSATFIYALEYDIALSVVLYTIVLLSDKEKGDSKLWMTSQPHGGSSQTSKTNSRKSTLKKNLTKTQKRKIRLLYLKMYLTQIAALLLLMVLPFLLGKVLEFLVMYLAFAVARYILGFNYSLHYKKEVICITVGVIVFGILSLAVPFFYVILIIAITMGIALAVLLHLSYKYKGLFLFAKISKPDKFALLYVFFDGDIRRDHVYKICKYKGLDEEHSCNIRDFMDGNKISFIAWKYHYSQRMAIYKIDESIDKLIH